MTEEQFRKLKDGDQIKRRPKKAPVLNVIVGHRQMSDGCEYVVIFSKSGACRYVWMDSAPNYEVV